MCTVPLHTINHQPYTLHLTAHEELAPTSLPGSRHFVGRSCDRGKRPQGGFESVEFSVEIFEFHIDGFRRARVLGLEPVLLVQNLVWGLRFGVLGFGF